jgi:hypothetical protein
MAVSGPQLELRVAVGAQARQVVVAARVEVDSSERLRVAAVEALRQSHHRRQRLHGAPRRAVEVPVPLVRLLRRGLSMVARDEGNDFDLLGIESAQVAILD